MLHYGTVATRLDLDQLRAEIRAMKRSHALYRLLKQELSALGYWKNKVRGNGGRFK